MESTIRCVNVRRASTISVAACFRTSVPGVWPRTAPAANSKRASLMFLHSAPGGWVGAYLVEQRLGRKRNLRQNGTKWQEQEEMDRGRRRADRRAVRCGR